MRVDRVTDRLFCVVDGKRVRFVVQRGGDFTDDKTGKHIDEPTVDAIRAAASSGITPPS